MPRVTQKQLAAELGLTPSAVSRALRNDRSIPRSTCLKVQRAAQAMGYRPDPEISKMMGYLRRSRSSPAASNLALLNLHSAERFASVNSFTDRMYGHLKRFAHEYGYSLSEFRLRAPKTTSESLRRIMRARGIDGIVIPGATHPLQSIDFDFSEFSVVTIGYSVALKMHRACQDQFAEMRLALAKLREAGYQRPGLALSTDVDHRANHHYTASFLSEHYRRLESDSPTPLLLADNISRDDLLAWLQSCQPDALISHFTNPSTILGWLREAGIRVPRDIGYISLDLPDDSLEISGIYQNYERVAQAAIDLLVVQINNFQRGMPTFPRVVTIQGTWIQGKTTLPPATAADGGQSRGSALPPPHQDNLDGDGVAHEDETS